MPQAGQEATSTDKTITKCPKIRSEAGYKCVCLNVRSSTGYVMFRRDRIGRRGGGVILYVKEYIQAYERKLKREADCDEAVWCKILSGNSKLTIGLAYRCPNIN